MNEYSTKEESERISRHIGITFEPSIMYIANCLEIAYTRGEMAQLSKMKAKAESYVVKQDNPLKPEEH